MKSPPQSFNLLPWREISSGLLVIAEIGVNHNGDAAMAHDLIDEAAEAGAAIVKFQTFTAAAVSSRSANLAPYQRSANGVDSQQELLGALELPVSVWPELADHCESLGVGFMSTAFDLDSLEIIESLNPVAHKVPSGEVTNLQLLHEIADCGRPTIVSTGMANQSEIDSALEVVGRAVPVAVLHCISSYPAPRDQLNLRAIVTLAERYGIPVGWSDHTVDEFAAVAAVALGATVLERHLTLDRGLPGPDHLSSDDPDRFRRYVRMARETQSALGHGFLCRMPCEEDVASVARRSWHLRRDVEAGATLSEEDVIALRPEQGLPLSTRVLGSRIRVKKRAGEPLMGADLVDPSNGVPSCE